MKSKKLEKHQIVRKSISTTNLPRGLENRVALKTDLSSPKCLVTITTDFQNPKIKSGYSRRIKRLLKSKDMVATQLINTGIIFNGVLKSGFVSNTFTIALLVLNTYRLSKSAVRTFNYDETIVLYSIGHIIEYLESMPIEELVDSIAEYLYQVDKDYTKNNGHIKSVLYELQNNGCLAINGNEVKLIERITYKNKI